MANAYKCDRCSRFYNRDPKDISDRFTVMTVRLLYPNIKHDLCPECTKKLTKFMEECNKEKEND